MQRAEIEHVTHERDVRELNDLARQWLEIGWRHTPEAPFDFRDCLERFYDWSSDGTQFSMISIPSAGSA